MAISKEHEAFIQQTAWKVGAEVERRVGIQIDGLKVAVDEKIEHHDATCQLRRNVEAETSGTKKSGRMLSFLALLIAFVSVLIAAASLHWRMGQAGASVVPETKTVVNSKGTP